MISADYIGRPTEITPPQVFALVILYEADC
jgi:hypothetical protein